LFSVVMPPPAQATPPAVITSVMFWVNVSGPGMSQVWGGIGGSGASIETEMSPVPVAWTNPPTRTRY
jgi:hypothetical protein